MLARATRQKNRQPHPKLLRHASTPFHPFPWLCPALQYPRLQSRRISDEASRYGLGFRKRRSSKDAVSSIHSRRSLAMATEMHDLDIPWDHGTSLQMFPPLPPSQASKYQVPPVIPFRPLEEDFVIKDHGSTVERPARYRMQGGASGTISDIYAVLGGCFCIGQLKRAEAIIKRLMRLNLAEDHLMRINAEYVRVSVEKIIQDPKRSDAQALHKWFELEIRGKSFDYSVLEYMLKASLREAAKKRDRLIQRYHDLLPEGFLQAKKDDKDEYKILTDQELEFVESIIEGRKIKIKLEETKRIDEPQDVFSVTKDVPEINSVRQKGLGLSSLKDSLSILGDKPPGCDLSLLTTEEQRARQKRIEEGAVRSAVRRWREESEKLTKMGMSTAIETKNLGARMWKWQLALERYLQSEISKLEELEASGLHLEGSMTKSDLTVWLRFLTPEHLAAVTILSTMTRMSTVGIDKGVPLSLIIMHVGKAIEDEGMAMHIARAEKLKMATKGSSKKSKPTLSFLKKRIRKSRKPPATAQEPVDPQLDLPFPDIRNNAWPVEVLAKVGAFLITALIKTATIPVSRVNPETEELISQIQPAFFHAQQFKGGKRIGLLMTNESLVDQMKREPVGSLLATHLPMVTEPAPWTGFNSGGFLAYPVKVLRIKNGDKDQRKYVEAAIERGDMEQTFRGLDILGRTSWRINKPVLDVMISAWNSGEKFAKIPPANPIFETPPKPSPESDPLHRKEYIRAIRLVENQRGALHSQRCFQNFQIEIARALRDEVFYFPHNMDFRGRVYPIPPLLNHMGADHCRGLLKFGVAKELGPSGLRWLKIHLANVYGFDKASLSERERFAETHLDDIYDSANNPLAGKRWWLGAEDVWQTLATCIELKEAFDSPDPTKYMSHLPVHQDGTCNGLQHYAALGGDEWGAKQVNLEPGDKPSDVYTAVSELVKEGIAEDLEAGDPCAKILSGKVNRKIVKQTVMTNVYGVTYIGAKAQVRKQLIAAYPDLPNHPDFHPGTLAGYIATKIFKGLSTMFKGAHEIQHWLGECANRISTCVTKEQLDLLIEEIYQSNKTKTCTKDKLNNAKYAQLVQFKSSVIWTTPLHVPVVQPYRTTKSRVVRTCLQRISLSEPHCSDPVSKRKQLQAFPPNFVHSLDATHMMLSALKCHDQGLSFAAVHDSFWTHAADVDEMNCVLRDAFIQIHSEDIIGRLASEFEVRYKGCFRLVNVKSGTSVVEKLYSFRRSKEYQDLRVEILSTFGLGKKNVLPRQLEELVIEKKVADMLESDDPEVRARAQQMRTSSRIFHEFVASERDDAEIKDSVLEDIGVGDILPTTKSKKAGRRNLNALDDFEDDFHQNDDHDIKQHEEEAMGILGSAEESEHDVLSDESGSSDAISEEATPDDLSIPEIHTTSPGNDVDGAPKLSEEELADAKSLYPRSKNQREHFARRASGATKVTSLYGQATYVWVPLIFPPVPKRGSYDVSRLRDSKYFFS